ncbi:TetR/AcrR family transcriptional regulator [Actinomadura sp. NBRC 104412]|uniref:TetR/AcrR family transcriptional regulator n=1 Tax=Actinomadura sp. NBRC 104412 TaxID=3032203 RepID=UPI00255585E7|nr:TetR/AcrR family transcriptional regulator [Actinomadura sp. NBRC 104412]
MGRPRGFDEGRALDAAMLTFWEKGYEATSTEDLCAATGLGRSSIYNTFRSKHDLFERSLGRYLDAMTGAQVAVLRDAGRTGAERVRAVLRMIVEEDADCRAAGGRSPGCLAVNSIVGLAGRDAAVAAMLERDTARRLDALRSAVEAGQRDGSITSKRDAGELSRFVNAAVAGMRVSGQGGAGPAVLESIAEITMDALTP